MPDAIIPEPVYFKSLHLENVKCFQGAYDLSLTGKNRESALWTIIIGNNNTGKTTLLKAVAGLEHRDIERITKNELHKNLDIPNGYVFFNEVFGREAITEQKQLWVNAHLYCPKLGGGNIEHGYGTRASLLDKRICQIVIHGYGTSRRTSSTSLTDTASKTALEELINGQTELLNTEEWLLQTDYAVKNGNATAQKVLAKIEDIFLKSHLLPDLKNIRFTTNEQLKSFVEVETASGWGRLSDLGYGYQVTIAWLADLAKKLFDRYPYLDNPLHGPAIVLVDEIDLHLHPEWQRKIIKDLSSLFPNVQFIVTAHSPLIVQSAENVNLIMLEKDDDTGSINVRQQFGSFQGWTVEEILRELMDMGEKTRSDRYLELMRQFEDGLLTEDYAAVKTAYAELDKILSPSSHQRKVLQIQMSSLIPA